MNNPLPADSEERKTYPIYSGFMAYFPRAIAAVAHHSWKNNEKHNPGEPLHWSKEKSSDHIDCVGRHMLEQDSVSIAWRAMANLEIELEGASQDGEAEAEYIDANFDPLLPDCPEGDYKLNPRDIAEIIRRHQRALGKALLEPEYISPPAEPSATPLEYDPDDVAFKEGDVAFKRRCKTCKNRRGDDQSGICMLALGSSLCWDNGYSKWEPLIGDTNAI